MPDEKKPVVVAVKESPAVGEEGFWIRSRVFESDTPIIKVIEWADKMGSGRLLLSIADEDEFEEDEDEPKLPF